MRRVKAKRLGAGSPNRQTKFMLISYQQAYTQKKRVFQNILIFDIKIKQNKNKTFKVIIMRKIVDFHSLILCCSMFFVLKYIWGEGLLKPYQFRGLLNVLL